MTNIRLAGATPVPVRLQPPAFTIDEAALAAAITPRTRMVIVNTPHNPSGHVLSAAEADMIARLLAPRPDVLVISDDVYERKARESNAQPRGRACSISLERCRIIFTCIIAPAAAGVRGPAGSTPSGPTGPARAVCEGQRLQVSAHLARSSSACGGDGDAPPRGYFHSPRPLAARAVDSQRTVRYG